MVIYAFRRGVSNRPARGAFISRSGSGDCVGEVQGEASKNAWWSLGFKFVASTLFSFAGFMSSPPRPPKKRACAMTRQATAVIE